MTIKQDLLHPFLLMKRKSKLNYNFKFHIFRKSNDSFNLTPEEKIINIGKQKIEGNHILQLIKNEQLKNLNYKEEISKLKNNTKQYN